MRIWYNSVIDQTSYAYDVKGNRVRIGRDPDNDIVLSSPFVAKEAAVLQYRNGTWEIVVLGSLNGIQVGEQVIYGSQRAVISSGQTIRVFPFSLTIELPDSQAMPEETRLAELDRELSRLVQAAHIELLSRMDAGVEGRDREQSDDNLLAIERTLDEIARTNKLFDARNAPLVAHAAGHCVRAELLNDMISNAGQSQQPTELRPGGRWSRLFSSIPEREQELKAVIKQAAALLSLQPRADLTQELERVERGFWEIWERRTSTDLHAEFRQYLALRFLKKEVKDIVYGYGPLEDLLRSPLVSEIMVVDRDHIYIEKAGRLENSGRRFVSDQITEAIIERIVSRVGRRIDRARPLVDARLTDGSRVNAVIPPLAVSGPCLTIRKFPIRCLMIDDLIAKGSLTRTVAEFLRASVLNRRNILISGGTESGKTTLLNCLGDFIPDKERIVTIEDTAELQLPKEHVVRLETKKSNVEGAGAYTIRDLVRNALRMRPDRIVVGECRGPEALDMLQAMNTGHDGSSWVKP